jgi:RHS repeat-associated protein
VTSNTKFAFEATRPPQVGDDLTGWKLYADLNGVGNVVTRYISGAALNQGLAQIITAGGVRWTLADYQGSIKVVTDGTGAVIDLVVYDAWGNITAESNSAVGGKFKYAGNEQDSWTGMYWDRARYFLPSAQIWLEQDPLGLGPDSNPYRYVGNGPTNGVDPSGRELEIKTGKTTTEVFRAGASKGLADSIIKNFAKAKIELSGEEKKLVKEITDGWIASKHKFSFKSTFAALAEVLYRIHLVRAARLLAKQSHSFPGGGKYATFPKSKYWVEGKVKVKVYDIDDKTGDPKKDKHGDPIIKIEERPGIALKPGLSAAERVLALTELMNANKNATFECAAGSSFVMLYARTTFNSDIVKLAGKTGKEATDLTNTLNNAFVLPAVAFAGPGATPVHGFIKLVGGDSLPGDQRSFRNPKSTEDIWKNENAIYLGGGLWFGHGIGIKTEDDMKAKLFSHTPTGATRKWRKTDTDVYLSPWFNSPSGNALVP